MTLSKQAAFNGLPPPYPESLLPQIQAQLSDHPAMLVVLDDDPTGTQTVYDLPVLTRWSIDALRPMFEQEQRAFYILTNTRSMTETAAIAINREIAANLQEAADGHPVSVVSRSDSTLRGHFPAETSTLSEALQVEFDGVLLIPFFEEGGRYTIHNIHYVEEGDHLLPASETPFARDASFGYTTAYLPDWVVEKTQGQISAEMVASISLADLRQAGINRVYDQLCSLTNGTVCIVNAVSYRDLEVLVLALLKAEKSGKRFIYRTAASFVRARLGLAAHPLLAATDLIKDNTHGGLVIVGSYVPKSSTQLEHLLALPDVVGHEIDVSRLLTTERASEIQHAVTVAEKNIHDGKTAAIYTSRALITADDRDSNLEIGNRISSGLTAVVRGIETRPAYIIAKGGITSSDTATAALNVQQATVMGQIAAGIPVWKLGQESRFPGMAYIVFPGNVGDDHTLAQIAQQLQQCEGINA